MIAELKPYPNAIRAVPNEPWLGAVPAHWGTAKLKHVLAERNERGFPAEPLLAATQIKGVVLKSDYGARTVEAMKDLHLLKLVRVGDFVISLRSFQGGIEFARNQGIISPAYTILYPRDPAARGYLATLFKSRPFIGNLSLYVTGIRQGQNIDYLKLGRSCIPLPPPAEQAGIVRFLGAVDRKVNRFIRAKRRLIEVLTEQKQAIITHAVTKGLNPSAPTKPSGIDWLGDMPAHWDVRRLKTIARMESGEAITINSIESAGTYPVYGGNGLRGYTERFTHEGDYALIGRQGALCGNVHLVSGRFWASEHAVVPTLRGVSIRWFVALVQAMNLRRYSMSAAQPGLSMEMIGRLLVPLPSIQEQLAIVSAIDERTLVLSRAVNGARREIDLIREYRTRLVADVVTGKIDVREALVPEDAQETVGIEDVADDSVDDTVPTDAQTFNASFVGEDDP